MTTRRYLDVDRRGRVSLAKLGIRDTQLLAVQQDDGTILLEVPMALTRAEIEHYSNPEAIAALARAQEQVENGEVLQVELRSSSPEERQTA